MATSLSMSEVSGYPTEDTMKVSVSFSVTYAGTYYVYFELYKNGRLIDTAQGSSFELSAGGSKSGLIKTFNGLRGGTSYEIVASLWNATTNTRLNITEPSVSFETEAPFVPPTIIISDKSSTKSSVNYVADITVNSPGTYKVFFKISYLGIDQKHWSHSFTDSISLSWEFNDIPEATKVTLEASVYDNSQSTKYDYDKSTIKTKAFQGPLLSWYAGGLSSTTNSVNVPVSVTIRDPGEFKVVFSILSLGLPQTYPSYAFTTNKNLSHEFTGLESNSEVNVTVTVVKSSDDSVVYDTLEGTITTLGPIRPDNWSWTSNVITGGKIPYTISEKTITCYPLTAIEWNEFIDRIIEFYKYLDQPAGGLTALKVSSGDSFNTDVPNAALEAIKLLSPPTALPHKAIAGSHMRASFFNGLMNALNSIE